MDGEGLDLGAMMSRIMENPEFANLVESLRTGTGNTGATDVKATSGEEAADEPQRAADSSGSETDDVRRDDIVSAIAPLVKNLNRDSHVREDVERRNRLLSALKPYLNRNRQEMIDRVMAISRITGLFDIMPGGHD